MPRDSSHHRAAAAPVLLGNESAEALEASVRQLLANGKSRTALENAKRLHKLRPSSASENLLLDAYVARINSLRDGKLELEAKSLLHLVRERFPLAKDRLDGLERSASASGGDLAGLLQPLNDPRLSSERRASIEKTIQTEINDLRALAGCAILPADHSLRRAAAALDQAFTAVTSGPVTDEQIALPEVSHRSPLAPWKLLVHAIACFHRSEDSKCLELLEALKPGSAPSRLAPVMQAIIGGKAARVLKPAEESLVSRTTVNLSELRAALANLDRALTQEEDEGRVLKGVRAAVRECQRRAPGRAAKLKQLILVRCGVERMDSARLSAAMDGAPRPDAVFLRMYARALELSGDPDDLKESCEVWDEFCQQAVREGWFAANGVEVATLYLHMADVLSQVPGVFLHDWGRTGERKRGPAEVPYFLSPEESYRRACAIDPHSEAFSRWLRWAAKQSVRMGEDVAREWNRVLPRDIEPLLYLMEEAEKRNAFPTALSYLEKAERLDALHSAVRTARLRLLARAALRHVQQNKPHLAAEKLATMTGLAQSRQGHRPAFLAALRDLICVRSGNAAGAKEARLEVETLLASGAAAELLIFGLAVISKQSKIATLAPVNSFSSDEKKGIPASLAKVLALIKDVGIKKFELPFSYVDEVETQFPKVSHSLDAEQIFVLGEMALMGGHFKLAWKASTAGLKRGGSTEPRFLLLRARAMPHGDGPRYIAVAAAAVELGRVYRDLDVVDQAIEIVRNPFGGDTASLTREQARVVVQRERESPAFPDRLNPGPDYDDILPFGPSLGTRGLDREETSDLFDPFEMLDEEDFDDGEFEKMFNEHVPKDIPPEVSKLFFESFKEAFLDGESPEEIMARLKHLGSAKPGKGRRKS